MQAVETANNLATSKYDALAAELRENTERTADEKVDLEGRLRNLQEQLNGIGEEKAEVQNELRSQERHWQHEKQELHAKYSPLEAAVMELREDRDEKARLLQGAQQKLAQRDEDAGNLEGQIMRMKTQTGDADTLGLIKRELSEQVKHIKELEGQNTDLKIEVKQLKKHLRTVEVVEEEKRGLEARLTVMEDLRKDLGEAQLQKRMLEDERRAWSTYLEGQDSNQDDEELKFASPADLAKAFFQVRLEKLSLVDQLGKVTPELASREEVINELEARISTANSELETLRAAQSSSTSTAVASDTQSTLANLDARTRSRLERQRALAIKEVEYLRAQLKNFDAEESEFSPEQHDTQKSQHIKDLENLVDQYRREIGSLQADLDNSLKTASSAQDEDPKTGEKRARQDGSANEATKRPRLADTTGKLEAITTPRANELSRQARHLQEQLSQAQTQRAVLSRELDATKSQLSALQSTPRIRVLELRDNPTSAHAAIAQSTLATLREENEALLAQLHPTANTDPTSQRSTRSSRPKASNDPPVPDATLTRLRADLAARDRHIASEATKTLRLKQRWSGIAKEFRAAVASILGWKLEIMPNGRVRVTSEFYRTPEGDADGGGDEPNSIVFDAENGTMKVSGGPKSRFAGEIRPLIDFWVEGRGEVPCFLAACTLEFWERAQGTMGTGVAGKK